MHPTPSTSASPAFCRDSSSLAPVFATDRSSPSKRRKLATPGPSSNLSSSSTSTTDAQIEAERRASSKRVLSVWSTLEDKYARRLDEDDIVDLRSGGLVRDRGVLSNKAGTWNIGCFADAEPSEEDYGNDDSAGPEGEDEDEDEIGGWGSGSELDFQFKLVHAPPVRELDPEDAEDLRAFLAAEEVRKVEHGEDDDLSEIEEPLEQDGAVYSEDTLGVDTDGSVVEVEAESALALSDEESPDELDGYDDTVGEGALLWEVRSDLLDNCSEPLGDESRDTIQGSAVKPKHIGAMARRTQTPAQLRTPPLSRSSVIPPYTVPSLPLRQPMFSLPAPPLKTQTPSTSAKKHKPKGSPKRDAHDTHPGEETKVAASPAVTPTKNLILEVLLPSRRRASTMRQAAADDEKKPPLLKPHGKVLHNPEKPPVAMRRPSDRRPSSSSPTKLARRHSPAPAETIDVDGWTPDSGARGDVSDSEVKERQNQPPPPPPKSAKRKRVVSREASPEHHAESSQHGRQYSASASHTRPIASSSTNVTPRRSRSQHPHHSADPSAPLDDWSTYPPHLSVAPSFPMPYPPHHPHAREPSVPPTHHSLDPQLIIAQAMQNLSYLAFASTPRPSSPASFAPSSAPTSPSQHPFHPHPSTPSHSHLMPPPSTPSWPWPSPYYPPSAHHQPPHHHPHSHAPSPWFYPQYSYPSPPIHASSSSSGPLTPGWAPGPPSSPPSPPHSSPTSSPLMGKGKGKGKGKQVSFSGEEDKEVPRAQLSGGNATGKTGTSNARRRRDSDSQRPSNGKQTRKGVTGSEPPVHKTIKMSRSLG